MNKILVLIVAALFLAGCSGMSKVPERKTYAQPKWYQDCAEAGSQGFLWRSRDYVYSCGAGESLYSQAADEQMYAIALNGFARRINSQVDSQTVIDINDNQRTTRTVISYQVNDTRIRDYVRESRGHFTMGGRHYTFVRLRMPLSRFEQLTNEAQGR